MSTTITLPFSGKQQIVLAFSDSGSLAQAVTLPFSGKRQVSLPFSATMPDLPDGGQQITLAFSAKRQITLPFSGKQQIILPFVAQSDTPLTLDQNSLILTADGINNTTVLDISEDGYSGSFSCSVRDPLIALASVSDSTLIISAIAIGSTQIYVFDDHGGSASVALSVYGELTAIETTPPNSHVGKFLVTRAGYTGKFIISPTDANSTIVSPLIAAGPGPITVSVKPAVSGSAELIRVTDEIGGEVDLVVTIAQPELGVLTYTIIDGGGNTLPPLVQVKIYHAGYDQIADNLVDEGYTLVGGRVKLSLLESTSYTAVFAGSQSPRQSVVFTAPASTGDTASLTITVPRYTSPCLSAYGYAKALFARFPTGWLDQSEILPDGNAYPLFIALGTTLASVDRQSQVALAAMRIYACEGNQLETWAADYLDKFPRYQNETDDHYRARIIVALQTPNCTLEAIRSKVQSYIDANPAAQQGAVATFDFQSNPARCSQVGIADGEGKFCLVLPATFDSTDAFFAGRSYAGRNSYVIPLDVLGIASDVDPNIVDIVNATRESARQPIYAQIQS